MLLQCSLSLCGNLSHWLIFWPDLLHQWYAFRIRFIVFLQSTQIHKLPNIKYKKKSFLFNNLPKLSIYRQFSDLLKNDNFGPLFSASDQNPSPPPFFGSFRSLNKYLMKALNVFVLFKGCLRLLNLLNSKFSERTPKIRSYFYQIFGNYTPRNLIIGFQIVYLAHVNTI